MTYGYREVRYVGPPGWRRLGPVTRALLLLTAGGYLASFSLPVRALLVTAPPLVARGEVWRLLTYPIVNLGIVNVVLLLLFLWFTSPELESDLGSASFAAFLAAATIAGSAASTALSLLWPGAGMASGYGIGGPLSAIVVSWALLGPSLPLRYFGVVPLTRRGFAVVTLVINTFIELEQTRCLAGVVFVLGGLPVAWYWARGRRGRGVRFTWRVPRFLRRRRFRVVKDEDRGRRQVH